MNYFENQISFDYKKSDLRSITSLGQVSHSSMEISELATKIISEIPENEKALPLDLCLFSSEEIKKGSLLDFQQLPLEKLPLLDENPHESTASLIKFMVNFLTGGLGTGGAEKYQFDGVNPKKNFILWDWLFQDIFKNTKGESPEFIFIKNISKGIANLKDFATDLELLQEHKEVNERPRLLRDKALHYIKKIRDLAIGESLPIYGGWGNFNHGGHALIYEFKRIKEGFDISIITSTGFQLADHTVIGDKDRLYPVILFHAVPETVLFITDDQKDKETSPAFIQAFIENHLLRAWDSNLDLVEEDVLEIFDLLEPWREPCCESGLETGQRGGTCVPSSTKQWVRKQVAALEGYYGQLIHHCKLKMTIATYRQLSQVIEQPSQVGEQARLLLKNAARNLLRGVSKLVTRETLEENLIDKEFAEFVFRAQATCFDLLRRIDLKEREIFENILKKTTPLELDKLLVSKRNERSEYLKNLKATKLDEYWEIESRLVPGSTFIIKEPKDILVSIKILAENKIKTEELSLKPESLLIEIQALIDQLPFPTLPLQKNLKSKFWVEELTDPFWTQIAPQHLPEILQAMEELANLYVEIQKNVLQKTCLLEAPYLPQIHASLLTLYTLTHYLSLRCELSLKEKLPSYQEKGSLLGKFKAINFADITTFDQHQGLIFLGTVAHQRIQFSMEYFDAFNKQAKFTSPPLFEGGAEAVKIINWKINSGFDELIESYFWQELSERDPLLWEKAQTIIKNKASEEQKNEVGTSFWHTYTQEQIENDFKKKQMEYFKTTGNMSSQGISSIPLPQRYVNCSDTTKFVALLQSSIVEPKERNLLCQNFSFQQSSYDYQFINIFRRVCHLLKGPMQGGTWNHQENINAICKSNPGSDELTVIQAPLLEVTSKPLEKAPDGFQGMENDHYKQLVGHPQIQRLNSRWDSKKSEGLTLSTVNPLFSVLMKVIRTLPEWELAPHQILYELRHHREELKNLSLQKFLLRVLFRSPVLVSGSKKEIRLGVGELIVKEKGLADAFHQFIDSNLVYFFQQKEQQGLDGATFLFSLGFYLSTYFKDAHNIKELKRFNLIPWIDRWLQNEEREAVLVKLHFYRLLFISVMPIESLIPQENFEEENLSELLQSWIFYQFYSEDQTWQTPMEVAWAKDFILNLCGKHLLPSLAKNEKVRKHLCDKVLDLLNLESYHGKLEWRLSTQKENIFHAYLRKSMKEELCWSIDLAGGLIYSSAGRVGSVNGLATWVMSLDFRRLFGANTKFIYRRLGGDNYSFHHSVFGSIRILGKSGFLNYAIQRKFPEDEQWYELSSLSSPQQKQTILDFDHTFWIPTETNPVLILHEKKISIMGYLTCLKEGKKKFAVTQEGKILEVDSHTGKPHNNSRYVDMHPDVSKFDLSENILVYRNSVTEKIEKLHFPRYSLQFFSTQQGLTWSENHEYILPEKMPSGYLGTFGSNSLYLASTKENSKGKLLVPFLETQEKENMPIACGTLKIDSIKSPWSQEGIKTERWHTQLYFEYNVEGGVIKPTSIETRLFLAYIELWQKNYVQAISLLNRMKPTEELSPLSMCILQMIEKVPLGCDHPDEKMVHLKVFAMMIQHRERQAKERSSDKIEPLYFSSTVELWAAIQLIESYLNSTNNISIGCRLPMKEEIYVIEKVLDDADYNEKTLSWKYKELYPTKKKSLVRHLQLLKACKNKTTVIKNDVIHGQRVLPSSKDGRYRGIMRTDLSIPGQRSLKKYAENKDDRFRKEKALLKVKLKGFPWLFYPITQNNKLIYTRSTGTEKAGKNAELFLEAARLANEGTPAKKREMMFQLRLWRLHSKGSQEEGQLDVMMALIYGTAACPKVSLFNKENSDSAVSFLEQIKIDRYPSLFEVDNFIRGVNKSTKFPILNLGNRKIHDPVPKFIGFDRHVVKLKDFGEKVLPLIPSLEEKNISRWKQLSTWRDLYADSEKYPKAHDGDIFSLDFSESHLNEGEEDFKDPFVTDLRNLQEDSKEGQKLNQQEEARKISDLTAEQIYKEALERKNQLDKEIQQKEEILKSHMNKRARNDHKKKLIEISSIGGSITKAPTLLDCVDALLSLDQRHYKVVNDNLEPEDIQKIAEITLEIEDLKSERSQLARLISWSSMIQNATDPLTREHACLKLDQEMQANYEDFKLFKGDVQVVLRVFTGRTEMIPQKKQLKILRKMLKEHPIDSERFKDLLLQLIMGGGKTKVLAALFLYLAAKKEKRLALFVVPDALFEVVKFNLGEDYLNAFNKHLLALRIERNDLNLIKLQQILKQIKAAKKRKEPILLTSQTLQTFQLEFLACCKQQLRQNCSLTGPLFKKMEILEEICREFSVSANCLLDEEHEILDCNRDLNFTEGEITPIPSMDNNLLFTIYQEALISKTLKIESLKGSPSIASLIRLEENEQSKMDTEIFKKHVVPVIANYLAENYGPLKEFIKPHRSSFIRYVSGQICSEIQDLGDVLRTYTREMEINEKSLKSFLPSWEWEKYGTLAKIKEDIALLLEDKYNEFGYTQKHREAVNLVALTKYLLSELIPETLKSSGKKNYGCDSRVETHTIVPFGGTNDPETTQFDDYLEEAAYYYQWGIAFPLKPKDVLEYGLKVKDQAHSYVEKNGEVFHETIEYTTFFEMFKITLDDLEDEEKLKKGARHASKNSATKAEVTHEIVRKRVGCRKERLTSNNMVLTDLVNSVIAMSGSTTNRQGLKSSLSERFMPDFGVDGRILHKLSERAKDVRIHEVELTSIENFFDKIFKDHPTPQKIRGLIETAGIFKNFKDYNSNRDIAEQIMIYFAKKQEEQLKNKTILVDPKIKGVLFFDKDPTKINTNCLYVWEKDKGVRMLGGTSVLALKEKGLIPEEYFVFYGQANITGTDIAQLPDSINIVTFDEETLFDALEQGTMRLRLFLYSQNIELAVTKDTRKILINEGKALEDFILNAQKAQTLKNSTNMVRYFHQQIDNIFYRRAAVALLQAVRLKDKNLKDLIALYEPFFVTRRVGSHDQRFGRIKKRVDTKEMLREYLKNKEKLFKKRVKGEKHKEVLYIVDEDVKKFLLHLDKAACLPKKCESHSSSIGVRNTVQTQTQTETKTETKAETKVETQTQLELKNYQMKEGCLIRQEKGLSREGLFELIDALREGKDTQEILPLKNQLKAFKYTFQHETLPYEEVFSAPIYGTDAYFYMLEEKQIVPVFSNKYQRPAKQILAVETEKGMKWLLLSEHEAGDVKKLLEILYREKEKKVDRVWLLQPEGEPIHKRKYHGVFPKDRKDVVNGLFEINVFLGHADYLNKKPNEFSVWISSKTELKTRFLKLKTYANDLLNNNDKQYKSLMLSLAKMKVEDEESKNPISLIAKRRMAIEMKEDIDI